FLLALWRFVMPFRILVIEDEANWREQFRDILVSMGLDVDIAEGVKDANALLEQRRYALVLLDVALDQSYFTLACQQFCDYLHRSQPDLLLVATTGKELAPPQMWTLAQSGVVEFIYKIDLQLPDFRRRIQDVLQKRHQNP